MAFYSEWPEILIWAGVLLVLVFIAAIIFYIITWFINLPDAEGPKEEGEETVVSCSACQSNIEVYENIRPLKVECANCGNQMTVRK